jgi:excisionase family DNA binding protein
MCPDREWLSPEEAATWLSVPLPDLEEAVDSGQLPAVVVGKHVRISTSALLEAAGRSTPKPPPLQAPLFEPFTVHDSGGLPEPAGLVWHEEIEAAEGFTHEWPHRKDAEPEAGTETYTSAWRATIILSGHLTPVLIGETERYGRGRLTVWLDRYPTAEFAETADGTGWASLIKPDSRRVLRPGDPIPPLYRGARVEPYRLATGLTGIGIPNGLGVVIDRGDLRSAVHHAAARWLGRQNLPVKPAA